MDYNQKAILNIPQTARLLGVSPEFYCRILKKFLDCRDEYLQPLYRSARDKDFSGLAGTAHKLKGAAAYLHINTLREQTFELEFQALQHKEIDYMNKIDMISLVIEKLSKIPELR